MDQYSNFYLNNELKIKKYFKYLGFGGITFFTGYIIYYFINRRRNYIKEIPSSPEMKLEDLKKFIRKLINHLLLKFAKSFDRLNVKRPEIEDIEFFEFITDISIDLSDNKVTDEQETDLNGGKYSKLEEKQKSKNIFSKQKSLERNK